MKNKNLQDVLAYAKTHPKEIAQSLSPSAYLPHSAVDLTGGSPLRGDYIIGSYNFSHFRSRLAFVTADLTHSGEVYVMERRIADLTDCSQCKLSGDECPVDCPRLTQPLQPDEGTLSLDEAIERKDDVLLVFATHHKRYRLIGWYSRRA